MFVRGSMEREGLVEEEEQQQSRVSTPDVGHEELLGQAQPAPTPSESQTHRYAEEFVESDTDSVGDFGRGGLPSAIEELEEDVSPSSVGTEGTSLHTPFDQEVASRRHIDVKLLSPSSPTSERATGETCNIPSPFPSPLTSDDRRGRESGITGPEYSTSLPSSPTHQETPQPEQSTDSPKKRPTERDDELAGLPSRSNVAQSSPSKTSGVPFQDVPHHAARILPRPSFASGGTAVTPGQPPPEVREPEALSPQDEPPAQQGHGLSMSMGVGRVEEVPGSPGRALAVSSASREPPMIGSRDLMVRLLQLEQRLQRDMLLRKEEKRARQEAEAQVKAERDHHLQRMREVEEHYETRIAIITAASDEQLQRQAQEISALQAQLRSVLQQPSLPQPQPQSQEPLNEMMAQLQEALNRDGAASLQEQQLKSLIQLLGQHRELQPLYAACHHENLKAWKRTKELEQQLKRQRADSEALAAKMQQRLQQALDDRKQQGTAAAQALKERLMWEGELQQAQDKQRQAEQRLLEMQEELQQQRQRCQQLEAQSAGVDLPKLQEGDAVVAAAKAEMADMRKQQDAMVEQLNEKIRWYQQNQELLTRNDQALAQQAGVVASLETRLLQYEGPDGKATTSGGRIRNLQQQVEELQKALQDRAPTSVAALVAAARPTPPEEQELAALKLQVRQLQLQLQQKDQAMENRLRALQQQHEKLKQQYSQARPTVSRQGKPGERSEGRERHLPKARQLQERLRAAASASASAAQPEAAEEETLRCELDALRQQMAAKDARICQLETALQRGAPAAGWAEKKAAAAAALEELLAAEARPAAQSREQRLSRELEMSQAALKAVQQAHTEALERLAQLRSEQQREAGQLQEQHALRLAQAVQQAALQEGLYWERRVREADGLHEAAQRRIAWLESSVAAAQQLASWTPSAKQFAELEASLGAMEHRHNLREAQLSRLVQDSQHAALQQSQAVRLQLEGELREKDRQVEGLRRDLSALILELQQLHLAIGMPAAAASPGALPLPPPHLQALPSSSPRASTPGSAQAASPTVPLATSLSS